MKIAKSILSVFLLCSSVCFNGTGTIKAQKVNNIPDFSESYELITNDGAWCWFSDPRAIYVENVIVGGYVDREGSIWSFSYNTLTSEKKTFKLFDKLDHDDHVNPSFMKLPDNRIVSFFSGHGATSNTPIYYRISKYPGDISEWDEIHEIAPKMEGSRGYCYTNAAQLSEEGNKTYLFFRGKNFKPTYITTEDFETWSEPTTFVQDNPHINVRPYMKVSTNGKDKIFLAFTDDHPRNNPHNSIYFACYQKGKYCNAKGEVIADAKGDPLIPQDCDIVYDAAKTHEKAWIWDVAFDKNEYPVIVYARFSNVLPEHSYWYARWNGTEWSNHKITKAGIWFQRGEYTKEKIEYECNYSGGVYLDHENPDIVYLSRPVNDIFEIERWVTTDAGVHWTSEAITHKSSKDNVRPFVIRGHKENQPSLLWMYNYHYPAFRNYHCGIRMNKPAKKYSADLKKEDIKKVARAVADWQINDFVSNPHAKAPNKGWVAGALYTGMFDWAELSGDDFYFNWLKKVFNKQQWQVGDRMYHADEVCVAQTYLDMYRKFGEDKMIIPTRARFDWVVNNPSKGSLTIDYSKPSTYERWSWCDALFMAPAAYVRLYSLTGDKKYMKFADKEFKATYNYLYDKEECLFYRDSRFFDKKEKNGEKVFWGRGNGWVIGGLVEILKNIPYSDKKYRSFYEELYKDMAIRLAQIQNEDGYWRASLLDPASYPSPETSASGFIVYGLAYGINQGYLPAEEYLPIVRKGWKALVDAVRADGKLGWVQPVGADPRKVTEEMTALYGVGAFLMAASEMYKLAD